MECDEIWSFAGCKAENVREEPEEKGWSDVWTWTALDPDSKLVPCWYVGTRDAGTAYHFIHDLADRLSHRVQLTTDGHRAYLSAVGDALETDIDYSQLQKIYGEGLKTETRDSPDQCMGERKAIISDEPAFDHVSTNHVEWQNPALRMSTHRFTRLTNGFSKKVENHKHAIALHFMHYDFCRIHRALRVTPAMEAGITNHVWGLEELVRLLDSDS